MSNIDVDMVFTYVNGSDPKFVEKRNKFVEKNNLDRKYDAKIRTISIEEIVYSVKSVLKFIPWIRKIFIVTDNQIPPIDQSLIQSGKIVIIDHKQIIDEKYLPTYNSDVIESCIHKIPDLSEIFLYNNDDFMHLSPVNREDIYQIENNKIRLKIRSRFRLSEFRGYSGEYPRRMVLTGDFLIKKYKKIQLVYNHHTKILRKSTLKYIENNFPKVLHHLRVNHFRSNNYIQYMLFAVSIDCRFHRNKITKNYDNVAELHLGNRNYKSGIFDVFFRKKAKFVCLNSMNKTFKIPLDDLMKKLNV